MQARRRRGTIFVLRGAAVRTFPPLGAPPPLELGWYFSTRLAGDESAARHVTRAGAAGPDAPPLRSQAGAGRCTAEDKRSLVLLEASESCRFPP